MAFVMVGSVLGAVVALFGFALFDLSLLAAIGLWAASGPVSVAMCLLATPHRPSPEPDPRERDEGLARAG